MDAAADALDLDSLPTATAEVTAGGNDAETKDAAEALLDGAEYEAAARVRPPRLVDWDWQMSNASAEAATAAVGGAAATGAKAAAEGGSVPCGVV